MHIVSTMGRTSVLPLLCRAVLVGKSLVAYPVAVLELIHLPRHYCLHGIIPIYRFLLFNNRTRYSEYNAAYIIIFCEYAPEYYILSRSASAVSEL